MKTTRTIGASNRGILAAVTAMFLLSLAVEAAAADATQLAAKYNCQACHAVDKKVVGPAYRDVASKYARDSSAPSKLEQKIKNGGGGVWGAIPMPANNVPDADLKTLVEWILALK